MKRIVALKKLVELPKYIFLAVALIITLFPIYWVLTTSLKVEKEFYATPPIWIPSQPTIAHYVNLFSNYNALSFINNSTIIALSSSILVMILSIPTAYAISKYKVGGEKFSFWILCMRMLPPVVIVIPLFMLFSKLGLVDTYIGLILPYLIFNIPFAVWLLKGFFSDIPNELHESACVDGCTEMTALIRIILPLITPGLVVVFLFCFIFTWNDLIMVLTLSRKNTGTLMMLLASTMQSPTGMYFGEAAAVAAIGIVPIFILTLLMQRYIVRGLTLGGVKG